MTDDLNSLLQKASQLAGESVEALVRGDREVAVRLRKEADLVWKKAVRLGNRDAKAPTLSKVPSARERAVSALMQLNVPASGKLIAAYCEAHSGEAFDIKTIASIRRDEFRAWTKRSNRETYVVPALEGPWFVPSRGRFALSHWPLSQRIIGPLSPRVDHLRICLHLADKVDDCAPDSDAGKRIAKLLTEHARSVIGALQNAWDSGTDLNTQRIRAAVQAELAEIEAQDHVHRNGQVEYALRILDEDKQIWGGKPPGIADGTSD